VTPLDGVRESGEPGRRESVQDRRDENAGRNQVERLDLDP
jgi:hypothetical protein